MEQKLDKKNRWGIEEDVKSKYIKILEEFLKKVSKISSDEFEEMSNYEFHSIGLDFTDTPVAPYHVWKMIEELTAFGYSSGDLDRNGWEQDFWIRFTSSKDYPSLILDCCGMTKECILRLEE